MPGDNGGLISWTSPFVPLFCLCISLRFSDGNLHHTPELEKNREAIRRALRKAGNWYRRGYLVLIKARLLQGQELCAGRQEATETLFPTNHAVDGKADSDANVGGSSSANLARRPFSTARTRSPNDEQVGVLDRLMMMSREHEGVFRQIVMYV